MMMTVSDWSWSLPILDGLSSKRLPYRLISDDDDDDDDEDDLIGDDVIEARHARKARATKLRTAKGESLVPVPVCLTDFLTPWHWNTKFLCFCSVFVGVSLHGDWNHSANDQSKDGNEKPEPSPKDSDDEKRRRLARESKTKIKQSGHELTHETTKKRTDTVNVHSKNVKSNTDTGSNTSNSNNPSNARRSTKKQSKSKQSKHFAKKRNASSPSSH